jgi:hypothetical protein
MTAKEVKVLVDRVLGAVSVFSQGGSLRLILPKSAERVLGTKLDRLGGEDSEKPTFVLIVTNKGLILRPLQDYLDDDDMRLTNSSQSGFR